MGSFFVSSITSEMTDPSPMLMTYGALSCTIIVIQCTDGTGALGHYPGDKRVNAVLFGLKEMIQAITGAMINDKNNKIDTILFAAGANSDEFQKGVIEGTKKLVGENVTVKWLKSKDGMEYSACAYFPKDFQVAFWESKFFGGNHSNPVSTIKSYTYKDLVGVSV